MRSGPGIPAISLLGGVVHYIHCVVCLILCCLALVRNVLRLVAKGTQTPKKCSLFSLKSASDVQDML